MSSNLKALQQLKENSEKQLSEILEIQNEILLQFREGLDRALLDELAITASVIEDHAAYLKEKSLQALKWQWIILVIAAAAIFLGIFAASWYQVKSYWTTYYQLKSENKALTVANGKMNDQLEEEWGIRLSASEKGKFVYVISEIDTNWDCKSKERKVSCMRMIGKK